MKMVRTLLILCFGTSFIATCYGVGLECYLGSLHTTQQETSSLKVVQCNSPNLFKENLELKGMASTNQADGSQNITHCLVDLKGDDTTDFSCDFDNTCSNGMKTIKRTNETVHCCNKSLCNSPSLVDMKMPALQCAVGAVSSQNTSVTSMYCNTQYCMSVKYYESSETVMKGTYYKCDVEKKCRQFNAKDGCKNVTSESKVTELCCCTTSDCNNPKFNDVQPMGTLPPGLPTDSSHSNMMYIGGVVSATIVAVLVTAGLIIVIRKCQQRKDEHVRYIYSQLTADLSEELDDDDAYMIVA